MQLADLLQYPGVALSLAGAVLTAQRCTRAKRWGFAVWLASNCLLIGFSAVAGAWGLLVMYVAFLGTSAVGLWNHRK